MDGPNVNWKFYSMLTDELKKEHNSHMLNIVHGAFKDGAVASGWPLDRLCSDLFTRVRQGERGLLQSNRKVAVCFEFLQTQVVGGCLGCRTYARPASKEDSHSTSSWKLRTFKTTRSFRGMPVACHGIKRVDL